MARPLVVGAVASLLFFSRPASAQIHWDASAQVGIQKRFLANQTPPDDAGAGFGPTAMLNAHVALLPLLRLGLYLGHDISPLGGDYSARDFTWGGVRAKVLSPWPRGKTHAYAFVGFGYEGVYQRSTKLPDGGGLVDGANDHFFEVPFGLGASYTFWKPWALVAELGMRAGFGHGGNGYEFPGPAPAGEDRFAIGLTVGIMLDR